MGSLLLKFNGLTKLMIFKQTETLGPENKSYFAKWPGAKEESRARTPFTAFDAV